MSGRTDINTGYMSAVTLEQVFARYEAIRTRLPQSNKIGALQTAPDLGALADAFDVFVFDAFGVLNIGDTAIAGAAKRVQMLREAGKRVFVLTNAASYNRQDCRAKFLNMGFDFTEDEVISSRQICENHLHEYDVSMWGVIAPPGFDPSELKVANCILGAEPEPYDTVDGILFLSSLGWTKKQQDCLAQSLSSHARPFVIANPDLVAPRETGLSLEPGWFAHEIQDLTGIDVSYHGKPFPSVYEEIERRIGDVLLHRIAMMGDTLHTDVLGANSRGWTSVLVRDHGLFSGVDVTSFIDQSRIRPDWIVPEI